MMTIGKTRYYCKCCGYDMKSLKQERMCVDRDGDVCEAVPRGLRARTHRRMVATGETRYARVEAERLTAIQANDTLYAVKMPGHWKGRTAKRPLIMYFDSRDLVLLRKAVDGAIVRVVKSARARAKE